MKDSILALIRDRQHVTFAELGRDIPGFTGDMRMLHASDPNIVIWPWCSDEAIDAVSDLLAAKLIFFHPLSALSILIEDHPMLPRVSRPPKGGYKEMHWLPLCFCDHPINP